MKVRLAKAQDYDKLLALSLQNSLRLNKRELSQCNVLEDHLGNIIGYSKLKSDKSDLELVCIKKNLKGRGLERILKNNILKGGELVHKAVSVNKEKLKTRIEELDGTKYLVAPVVMVREQVLNGELLPAEEIEKSAPGWNGRPVVVYHPQDEEGRDILANDPKVVPDYEVGKVYNVVYDKDTTKLKGEIWIDISKAKRKNKDTKLALKMIENSDKLEVSTGYIVNDLVIQEGTFNGEKYTAIQRDILPDHLALLPQETGACSWEDGAGVRNNTNKFKSWFKRLVNNLSAKGSITCQVAKALRDEYDDFDWVCDLYHDAETNQDFAVFFTRGNEFVSQKMYAISYTFDGYDVVLGDTLQEVEQITHYIPKKEEPILNRQESIVRDVIANSKGRFGRKDKSTLLNCPESVLLSMLPASKRKAYITNDKKQADKDKIIANFFKGKKVRLNEDEEILIQDLITMPEEEARSVVEQLDESQIQEVEMVLEDVVAAAEIVQSLGDEVGATEEFATTVAEVVSAAEGLMEILEETEPTGEETTEDPTANVDTSDIFDPEENPEEETVGALETASKKPTTNRRKRMTANKSPKKSMTLNDYINSIPDPEAREFIKNGIAESKRHRQNLITDLINNKACQFTEQELKKMETNQLEKIHAMLNASVNNTQTAGSGKKVASNASYSIRGVQAPAAKEEDLGYVPLTVNIFKKEDK